MISQTRRRTRRFGGSRHSVVARDDFYRPLPVKSEPVLAVVEMETPSLEGAAELPSRGQETIIIDESERLLTAGQLYAEALSGVEPDAGNKQKLRIRRANPQRIQLWGAGTSGVPRRGSRTIRLFRAQPDAVFAALRAQPFGTGLRLDAGTFKLVEVLDEPELHVDGELAGAFALRAAGVQVSVRAARFNSMFTAIEVRLTGRGHPRRFFRAAHEAIESLPVPGRT